MERIEADATPAEVWLQSLNATCNRLSTQYLNMLKAASSVSALDEREATTAAPGRTHGPRGVCVRCGLFALFASVFQTEAAFLQFDAL